MNSLRIVLQKFDRRWCFQLVETTWPCGLAGGTLVTVQSMPRAVIGIVSSSREHDTRENEKSSILIS